ncbi:MAG: YihY/virulence factor BrkB family protein [Phenylobacterium sp.]|uniref:YihY/virulence factor BrkB family protein n=1 Tax=Phenylobacterium sp. TaxID=1871053 RepID=UPI0027374E73|nr:YihY/virulence factor BrkB family protein [Phenylobacterium sp.]MDP3173600.1 YihY/virulence factor BrkB family protein [Phenylobacterium sp.]
MTIQRILRRIHELDLDPAHLAQRGVKISAKALTRLWGRDVMLYVGGVSFFALLAAFPALAILIGLYGLLADPAQAARQVEAMVHVMPPGAREIVEGELTRLASAPLRVSAQSGVALIIGIYAAHRGVKALLAGLSFIHEEDEQRGFVGFNLMALLALIAAFAMLAVLSGVFFALRLIGGAFHLRPLAGAPWLYSEWTWASLGLTVAMTLIYRFAMSRKPVAWRASVLGGIAATLMALLVSWASAFYVEQIAQLGATYGSVATVVVLLIWLSWTVNAVFFGGALATEVEIAIDQYEMKLGLIADQRGDEPIISPPGS